MSTCNLQVFCTYSGHDQTTGDVAVVFQCNLALAQIDQAVETQISL